MAGIPIQEELRASCCHLRRVSELEPVGQRQSAPCLLQPSLETSHCHVPQGERWQPLLTVTHDPRDTGHPPRASAPLLLRQRGFSPGSRLVEIVGVQDGECEDVRV